MSQSSAEQISYCEPAPNVVHIPGVTLGKRGLRLDEGMDRSTFLREVLPAINYVQDSVMFWWGDALIEFEDKRKWGQMYEDSEEASKYNYGTLANAKWVCSRIQFSRRRENLSFGHHQEIAAIEDPAEQDMWLQRCVTEKLSREKLRSEIRKSQEQNKSNHKPLKDLGSCEEVRAAVDLTSWIEEQKPESWPRDRRETWAKHLTPIARFRDKLLDIDTVPA